MKALIAKNPEQWKEKIGISGDKVERTYEKMTPLDVAQAKLYGSYADSLGGNMSDFMVTGFSGGKPALSLKSDKDFLMLTPAAQKIALKAVGLDPVSALSLAEKSNLSASEKIGLVSLFDKKRSLFPQKKKGLSL
jgi:hypothetical protein